VRAPWTMTVFGQANSVYRTQAAVLCLHLKEEEPSLTAVMVSFLSRAYICQCWPFVFFMLLWVNMTHFVSSGRLSNPVVLCFICSLDMSMGGHCGVIGGMFEHCCALAINKRWFGCCPGGHDTEFQMSGG